MLLYVSDNVRTSICKRQCPRTLMTGKNSRAKGTALVLCPYDPPRQGISSEHNHDGNIIVYIISRSTCRWRQMTLSLMIKCFLWCNSQSLIQELRDGGGRRFFFQKCILTTAGMLPRQILKSKASNNTFWSIFWPKSGRFFNFKTLNGGGGAQLHPPLDPPLTVA